VSALHPILVELAEASASEVNALIAKTDFPLVDATGVTFVYRGEADGVHLRHWIYGLPTAESLAPLGNHDIWYLHLDLPPGSRIEYKFEIVTGGTSEWIVGKVPPLCSCILDICLF